MRLTTIRGRQDDPRYLKLSHDRKVSPRGWYQRSRDRWVATIPNSFGLPAGDSCPGKTEFCRSCYAESAEQSSGVGDLVNHNLRLLLEAGTRDAMADLIAEMIDRYCRVADANGVTARDRIFRIHWDGDFFSVDYALAWADVIVANPTIAFWVYTRSFVDPVDVVPYLADIDNLALYLSADAWNIDRATVVTAEFEDVRLALCGVDYASARRLSDRPSIVCPENAERMPLMSEDGRGACVDCRLCPDARRDVIFSTSHRERVMVAGPKLRVAR